MDFDQHKESYREQVKDSISIVGADSDLVVEVKADRFRELLQKYIGDPSKLKMLDLGCGIGLMDKLLSPHLGEIYGADVSKESIELAARTYPSVKYTHYDGNKLPYADDFFDATMAVCVMHHVPPQQWPAFVSEMKRVTKPSGIIVVFEHNPWNPLTRVVVSRCEFDADAVLLSHLKVNRLGREARLTQLETKAILYFPWRGKAFRRVESLLGPIPFGGQYYAAFRK